MKELQEVALSGAFVCYCLKHMASQRLRNQSKWCEQNAWLEFKDFWDSTNVLVHYSKGTDDVFLKQMQI